ncbi:MAG TPA: hypothetical protein VFJ85_02905 [Acidimicrobiales bacterium]|nr:hypothetical protein [Acidimicrobiales bacterium]
MAWVRLDEAFPDHPKVARAGPLASWLHVCALAYCNRLLTDGFVPSAQVAKLADLSEVRATALQLAERLVDVGMWTREAGGFRIHDFGDYQPTKAQVEAERQAKAAAGRKGARSRWSKPPPMANGMAPAMAERWQGDGKADGKADGKTMRRPMAKRWPDPDTDTGSPSRLSEVHPDAAPNGSAPGGAGEGKSQVRTLEDPFVARIVARLGAHRRHLQPVSELVQRWRKVLDERLIDQAIGLCEQADERPRTVAYFEAALARTAAAYGVEIPPASEPA